jgi:hypothetical protein
MRLTHLFIALLILTALPVWAHACPSCQEAPAAGTGSPEDENNNPAAYNNSIYVMVGVPYLSFGIVAFLIYRGVKKNEEFRRAHGWTADPHSPANPIAST